MKRLVFLAVVLAALAGGYYWVRTRYDGDFPRAWASLQTSALALVGKTPAAQGGGASGQGGAGARGSAGAQNPRVPVITAVAQGKDLPITRTSVGSIEPIAIVTVRARIEGEIVEQRVRDGQMVKEGDVLFLTTHHFSR